MAKSFHINYWDMDQLNESRYGFTFVHSLQVFTEKGQPLNVVTRSFALLFIMAEYYCGNYF